MAVELTDEVIRASRAKWTGALRSGDYQQGAGQLAIDGYTSFCCLGVACEVIGREYDVERNGGDEYTFQAEGWFGVEGLSTQTEATELPPGLIDALGITHDDMTALIKMNDADPQTPFPAIADYIDSLPISRDPYGPGVYV